MNPSYFYVNYRGTIGFDPMEKYSKMTNKWRHASRNPCIFCNLQEFVIFFCHFCDMYDKSTNNDKKW